MLILYFIWTGPCACGRSYQSHSTHVLTMRLIKSRVSRVLRNLDFDKGPLHSTCSLRSIFMYKESSYREGTASYVCLQAIPLWCNLSCDDSLLLNLLGIWCSSYSCFHHLVGDGIICTGIVWVKSSTTRSPLPSWMSWICLVAIQLGFPNSWVLLVPNPSLLWCQILQNILHFTLSIEMILNASMAWEFSYVGIGTLSTGLYYIFSYCVLSAKQRYLKV